jgi:HEAT repeat protein
LSAPFSCTQAVGLAGQGSEDAVAYQLATKLAVVLATDSSAEVRREAAFSLGRLASDGEGVVEALRDACHDRNGHVKGYAAKALERIGTLESMRAVVEYLQTVRYA